MLNVKEIVETLKANAEVDALYQYTAVLSKKANGDIIGYEQTLKQIAKPNPVVVEGNEAKIEAAYPAESLAVNTPSA